ncbi:conjugal transfer protein TraF [Marinimicrobium sp. ARAG 43.8]|uniref:conjugal transfer protein TraF n=1 Tax=Marinimicrobium sp. ARAG 43.8 TaxID=3418719 RepID=UPI003CF7D484
MKKTLLSLALMATTGTAMANGFDNGRLGGMGGAGYATGNYADGVLLNPSLGSAHGEKDDFALVINVGALGQDEDKLLDGLEDLADYLDLLENRTASQWGGMIDPNNPEGSARELLAEEADEVEARLRNIDNRNANINAGASFVVAIPNDWMSVSLVGKTRIDAAVTTLVDDGDFAYIRGAVGEENFDASGLQSRAIGRGAAVSEVGLALSKSLATGEDSQLLVGATPKWMHVMTFVYTATVEEFDEDDFDGDDYTVESDDFNLDLGATYLSGNMRYALTVSNLISNEYDTIVPGETIEIEPRATAALGYRNDWLTAEVASDLTTSKNFTTGQDTRFVRAGLELDLANWVQLRAGMRQDLEDNEPDQVSVGLGFSPFGVVNLDIAVFGEDFGSLGEYEDATTGGASVQLGLRF